MPAIRENILRMQPYAPGKPAAEVTRELGVAPVIKLASNENPLGPSPLAVDAVRQAAGRMHIYPDASGYELKVKLAERFEVPFESIVLGNGSDELIHLLGLVFLGGPDDEVIVGDPSFVRYDASAHLASSRLLKVPLDENFRHDLPAMAAKVSDRTKLVFIANPNNPTGTIVRSDALNAFLDSIPDSTVVVLDEAYFEFAADVEGFPDGIEIARRRPNVVSLRTFSKTYGLAGIRIGYGIADTNIVDAMNRVRAPFNVNSLAQAAAIAALDDVDHIARTVANNQLGLDRLATALRAAGATPYESCANFVFADLHQPAFPVVKHLMESGIVIRGGEMFGTPSCVRVSVGTPQEMDRFCEAIGPSMEAAR